MAHSWRPTPTSRWEARASLLAKYDELVKDQRASPFLYPWATIATGLVFAFLLIPLDQTRFTKTVRSVVWISNAIFSLYGISSICMRLTLGYGGGLLFAWLIIWTAVLLLNNDPQRDFKRLESFRSPQTSEQATTNATTNGSPRSDSQAFKRYRWEPFPQESIRKRVLWVADLLTGFRGIGWNWELPTLAPLPLRVRKQLGEDSTTDSSIGRDGTRRYHKRDELLRHRALQFIVCYLLIDLLIIVATHDPYFWGAVDSPAPAYLPSVVQRSAFLCRAYRNICSMLAISAALQLCFALGPLVFVGLLGSERIGVWGEPWAYPDVWGSFGKVLDHGLIGFWGSWWHQAFRYAFESNASAIVRAVGWSEKAQAGKLAKLLIVFGLSGFMHASGSYSALGDSRPLSGSFLFFVLQPFGIMLQLLLRQSLRKVSTSSRIPKPVQQLTTLTLTYFWLHFTAPWLCDDFARTGIWMIQPLPISPLGALGLGDPQDGWWCWKDGWGKWYRGQHWWQTGVAL